MKKSFWLILLACSTTAIAADKKPMSDVDINALTAETQITAGGNSDIDLAWWIPLEFWEVSMQSAPDVQPFQVKQILDALRPYSVLAVVQADISNFGAFSFYGEDAISNGMLIEHIDEDGVHTTIPHGEEASPDVVILLNQMVPVLAAAMGNMGQNFYFFPLPNFDTNDNQLISPYETGSVRVTLNTRKNAAPSVLEIELPLDSLHVPRMCPNGKQAHVSWTYCPWSGEKIKN